MHFSVKFCPKYEFIQISLSKTIFSLSNKTKVIKAIEVIEVLLDRMAILLVLGCGRYICPLRAFRISSKYFFDVIW